MLPRKGGTIHLMTDPNQGPRPVGPPPPQGSTEPSRGATSGSDPTQSWQQRYGPAGGQPEWRAWTWTSSRRSFPWLAILLVVLGMGLLVELLIPELTFFSLVLLAAGTAFAVAAIAGRIVGATVPALVLIAWALARMGAELGYLSGDGWSSSFVGIAFLVGWGLGRYQHARRQWALYLGAILGIIGLADVSDALPFDLDMAIVIPLAMIVVGLILILRRRPFAA